MIATASPAYAYIDPGTGSIVLQVLIGGIAATLFIVRGYFHKLKSFLTSRASPDRDKSAPKE